MGEFIEGIWTVKNWIYRLWKINRMCVKYWWIWLIDWIVFYAVSAMFQRCNGGNTEYDKNGMFNSVRDYNILFQCTTTIAQLLQKDMWKSLVGFSNYKGIYNLIK